MAHISHIPEPYPDESLYSYLVRIHDRSVNLRWPTTCLELFGAKDIRFSPYLFRYFRRLSESTGLPADLILKMSGAEFYLSFMNRTRQQTVRDELLSDDDTHAADHLGLKRNPKTSKKYLYYCPECVKEDVSRYGSAYFHTVHQLEGVCACPKHGCQILTYPNRKVFGNNLVYLKPTDADSLIADPAEIRISQLAMEVQDNPNVLCREIMTEKYCQEAAKRHMVRSDGVVVSNEITSIDINSRGRLFNTYGTSASPRANLLLWKEWDLHVTDFKELEPSVHEEHGEVQVCPLCGRRLKRLSVYSENCKVRYTWHCEHCNLYANSYAGNPTKLNVVQYGEKFLDWIRSERQAGKSMGAISRETSFSLEVIIRLLKTGDATPITDMLREMESGNSGCSARSIRRSTKLYDPDWYRAHLKPDVIQRSRPDKPDLAKRDQELLEQAKAAYARLCQGDNRICMKTICREMGIAYQPKFKTDYPNFYLFLKDHCDHGKDRKIRRVRNYILEQAHLGRRVEPDEIRRNVKLYGEVCTEVLESLISQIYRDLSAQNQKP